MMNADARLERAPKGCAATVGLLGVVVTFGTGCASDYRISLADFLHVQQTIATEKQESARLQPALDLDAILGPYKVGPGDVLAIHFAAANETVPLPELQVRVDRNGEIDLPLVGAVNVVDLELEDAEDAIRKAYVPGVYQDMTCHVGLVAVDTTNVLVVGAVAAPGLVPLRRNERNMLFAIVGAGGISDAASGEATLRRIRRPEEQTTVDLTDPVQLNEALALDPLEPGDILHVHAAQPNMVFVGGLVNRPGMQTYPLGTQVTALQALAAAQGLRTDVFPKHGTLVRRMPSGQDMHVKLDLNRLATGKDPNITLAAGDILWVPETLETKIQSFLNHSLFLRAGVSVTYNVTGVEFLNRRSMQTSYSGSRSLEDSFDPLGFLNQNTLLQNLSARPVVEP